MEDKNSKIEGIKDVDYATDIEEMDEVAKSFNNLLRTIDKLSPFHKGLHQWKEKALDEMYHLIPFECNDAVEEYKMPE